MLGAAAHPEASQPPVVPLHCHHGSVGFCSSATAHTPPQPACRNRDIGETRTHQDVAVGENKQACNSTGCVAFDCKGEGARCFLQKNLFVRNLCCLAVEVWRVASGRIEHVVAADRAHLTAAEQHLCQQADHVHLQQYVFPWQQCTDSHLPPFCLLGDTGKVCRVSTHL